MKGKKKRISIIFWFIQWRFETNKNGEIFELGRKVYEKDFSVLGLILTLVLCCAFVPVNAAEEECTHENVTFEYFLDEQDKPVTCEESGIAKYTCDDCGTSLYKKESGNHVIKFQFTELTCTQDQKVVEFCTVCEEIIKETV